MQPFVDTAEIAPPRQLHPRRSSGNPFLLRDNGLELRLASSRSEKTDAQRLRFEVFHLELQLGLTSSRYSGLDQDAHDGHCDHLLVIDTERDCLVGTYRLLSFDRVPSFGFYSESEFDLTNVKRSGLRLLELGRSCVALEYRDGRVISLLFRGIAEYLRRTDADALMGTITGGGLDVAALASGQGDGLVPAHSVLMSNESGWASEIAKDAVGLGAGTHPGLLIDPRVIAGVALTIGK